MAVGASTSMSASTSQTAKSVGFSQGFRHALRPDDQRQQAPARSRSSERSHCDCRLWRRSGGRAIAVSRLHRPGVTPIVEPLNSRVGGDERDRDVRRFDRGRSRTIRGPWLQLQLLPAVTAPAAQHGAYVRTWTRDAVERGSLPPTSPSPPPGSFFRPPAALPATVNWCKGSPAAPVAKAFSCQRSAAAHCFKSRVLRLHLIAESSKRIHHEQIGR